MIKLDKTKIYDLSELTSNELDRLLKHMQENYGWGSNNIHTDLFYKVGEGWLYNKVDKVSNMTNAKELFYTLENVQVDCRYLTEEQIDEMADVYKNNGFRIGSLYLSSDYYFLNDNNCNYCLVNTSLKNKTTITYEKFIELFGNKEKSEEFKNLVEVLNEELEESRNEDYCYVFSDDSKELFKANSIGEGVNIRLELTPEGVVKFLANKGVFLSPEDYKKLFE